MDRRSKPGRFGWPAAIGLLISGVLIWWTLHDVSFAEVWEHVKDVRWLPFVAAITVATLTFPLRTIRWQYLLRLEGERLPFVPLWHATAIGFMSTNITYGRAGEVVRAYAARKLTGVRFTAAFSSIAVERAFDTITLVAMLAVATWAGGFSSETEVGRFTLGGIGMLMAVAFSVALVVGVAIVSWPQQAVELGRKVTERFLPKSWSEAVVGALEGVISGLDSLRSPKRIVAVAIWSIVVWAAGAASFWIGFLAFGIWFQGFG